LNFRTVYKLAIVLTTSQIRGYQRSKFIARIFGDPRIILVIDSLLLVIPGLVGYVLLSSGTAAILREMIRGIEAEALAGIPSAIMFSVILFGVLYEISQPIQSLSTDLVNWLPISPTEYVAGSTLSESYIYSFMLSLLLGVLLGPALLFGMIDVWFVAALMATIALFVGACVVEVLDAITNRISSSFYKKSGRSGIVFRLAITVILLVFVQLLFSGQVIAYLLRSVIETVRIAWFVPVVWPSVAVLGASQGSTTTFLLFASLSMLFLLGLFGVAANFRARFWVPVPVSIKLSTQSYHVRSRGISMPGIGPIESAIMRKDLRSLTRRREMARFLAIPFVLAVTMGISFFPLGGQSMPEAPGLLAIVPLYVIPVAIFVGLLAMTSIGQEGYAVWNIYAAPITPSNLLRAKVLFATVLGLAFAAGMLALFWILLKPVVVSFWIMLGLGVAVVFEGSSTGIYFAARFPDFREMVRSRYVGVWGSLFGMLLGLITAMLTASPIIVSVVFYGRIVPQLAFAGVLFALVVFIAAWKLADRQINILLQNIRS
jgi:hypothetical protein